MKKLASLFAVFALLLALAAPGAAAEAQPETGRIYLYGETHATQAHLDQELAAWNDYYHQQGLRDLFIEAPSYAADFLNLWMQAEDDGLETAVAAFRAGSAALFDTAFSRGEEGIPVNGLVWMGTYDEMLSRMEEKIEQGFTCVKLKIGAIDFDAEMDLLKRIRSRFSHREMQIRLDANCAFPADEALYKLELLSQYAVHSIEQPIRTRRWSDMAGLCRDSPLPIALDEELIGVNDSETKAELLNIIKPAYIVLKPSLHGGMRGVEEWKRLADDRDIGSWITSALEANVGLNAVAQLAARLYGDRITTPQGLGTGLLYTDNIDMPVEIRRNSLWFRPQ